MSMLERVLYSVVIVALLAAVVSLRSSNSELSAQQPAELASKEASQ